MHYRVSNLKIVHKTGLIFLGGEGGGGGIK